MKTYLKALPAAAAAAWLAVLMGGIPSAQAQTTPAPPTTAQPEKVQGEVMAIDMSRSRITLKHARIKSIGMDAMTMPFKVSDAAMLGPLKPGDKVQFSVAMHNDELLITHVGMIKGAK
ncbi:MAG: copper-binding protein [Pseudomonadota bacterium]